MPLWISLVIGAQLINAVVSLLDRYLVASGKIGRPIVLAFYVSLLSALSVGVFAVGLLPLSLGSLSVPSFANVMWPTWPVVVHSLVSAVTFIVALVALFESFRLTQASDVVPVVSSVSAVMTLLLSFYFLDATLTRNFLWGFLFLVVGTFLVAHFRMTKRLAWLTFVAGTFFAAHYIAIKLLFAETSFDNAFFWSRIIIALVALSMLLLPNCCSQTVAHEARRAGGPGVWLLLLNKTLAGVAGVLVLKAVELGDVAIVQALAGLQFVFLLLFSIFLGHKAPVCVGENCELHDRIQKVVSVSIIVTGFVLLFM